MKRKKSILNVLFAAMLLTSPASAGNILLTVFDYSGYNEMETALEATGHTVTQVDARTGGNVAAAILSGSYDQVFLFDLTGTSYLNAADVSALSDFWSDNRGLVIDTRSYGYHYQPTQTSEVALLQNVAANLDLSGGGVWVGTDHNPNWTTNANPFLNAIGVNPVTGIYSNPVNYADPSSVLLSGVTPTQLWGGGQSIGEAPLGLQPNGITMYLHFGHVFEEGRVLPYISASFPLEGPMPEVPEPATVLISAAGLLALGASKYKKSKQ